MNKIAQDKTLHLIVKYGNQLSQGRDTIAEHRAILKDQGTVWFGKMGAGLSQRTIRALLRQIETGTTTYLFLFRRSGQIHLHRGRIAELKMGRPDKDDAPIPGYYAECGIDRQMKLWVMLSSLTSVKANTLAAYHTVSSGKKALHTASKSMASVFLIADGPSMLEPY